MSHYAYGLGWGSASAGLLDLFKMTVAEGGIRTPLLVAGPNVSGGRQIDAFAYVWDLMPTILDYAGIEHGTTFEGREVEPMRGRSMAGLLSGSSDTVYADDEFVGGEMLNGKWMRQGRYKAVTVSPPYGSGVWSLYDVMNDPGETQDLAAKQPAKLKQLQNAWDRYAEEVGETDKDALADLLPISCRSTHLIHPTRAANIQPVSFS